MTYRKRYLPCFISTLLLTLLAGCGSETDNSVDLSSQSFLATTEFCVDIEPYNDGDGRVFNSIENTTSDESCTLSMEFEAPTEVSLSSAIDPIGCCGTLGLDDNLMVIGAGRNYFSQFISNDPGDRRALLVFEKDDTGTFQFSASIHEGKNIGSFDIDDGRIVASGGEDNIVYVYEKNADGVWASVELSSTDTFPAATFGHAVAIDGNRIVVTAIKYLSPDEEMTTHPVYVYDLQEDNTWVNTATLYPTTPLEESDLYGADVEVSGTRVVVGAPAAWQTSNQASGSVFLFEQQDSDEWTETELAPGSPAQTEISARNRFGISVAVNSDVVLVGDPESETEGDLFTPGAVYLFRQDEENNWESDRIIASDYQNIEKVGGDMGYGRNVEIKDNIMIVGGAGATETGGINNSVYLYSLEAGYVRSETIVYNSDSEHSYGDYFGFSNGELAVARIGRFFEDYVPQVLLFDQKE